MRDKIKLNGLIRSINNITQSTRFIEIEGQEVKLKLYFGGDYKVLFINLNFYSCQFLTDIVTIIYMYMYVRYYRTLHFIM